jgi:hypothetical protein
LEKLFGKNSKLIVEDFSYSTQLKNPYCLATLYVENVDECLEFFPFAIEQLIQANYFEKDASILVIHSGGLQGNRSLPDGTLKFC